MYASTQPKNFLMRMVIEEEGYPQKSDSSQSSHLKHLGMRTIDMQGQCHVAVSRRRIIRQ